MQEVSKIQHQNYSHNCLTKVHKLSKNKPWFIGVKVISNQIARLFLFPAQNSLVIIIHKQPCSFRIRNLELEKKIDPLLKST